MAAPPSPRRLSASVVGAGVLALLAVTGIAADAAAAAPVVLVTGATGRTGSLLYVMLKESGVSVRAFVRNATKARDVLGCTRCDASEGIYVGDLTQKGDIDAAVKGATALAVATSAIPTCTGPSGHPATCHYPEGAFPVDVDWNGGKAQIEAFARANAGKPGPVVLCSSMGTTNPDSFLEKLGNGHIGFFKLNEEAFLMSSGLPYTIIKPCGLTDGPGAASELLVGHDDEIAVQPPAVSRSDVARVMAEALLRPEAAAGLRFDLCSRAGPATKDLGKLLEAARYPWAATAAAEAAAPVAAGPPPPAAAVAV